MLRINGLHTHDLFNYAMIRAMVDLVRKFGLTPSAVSYVAQRGEEMAKEGNYQLEL